MDTLLTVVTIKEAARLWGKHPNTVRAAIYAKSRPFLVVRRADPYYLITVESLRRRWGDPKIPLDTLINL